MGVPQGGCSSCLKFPVSLLHRPNLEHTAADCWEEQGEKARYQHLIRQYALSEQCTALLTAKWKIIGKKCTTVSELLTWHLSLGQLHNAIWLVGITVARLWWSCFCFISSTDVAATLCYPANMLQIWTEARGDQIPYSTSLTILLLGQI